MPLINQLHGTVDQVWYADDTCACGSIQDLLIWWNQLCIKGPALGYFVNAPKTWLVSKERFHSIIIIIIIIGGTGKEAKPVKT